MAKDVSKLRNLQQYKNLSDEEFEAKMVERGEKNKPLHQVFDKAVKEKKDGFEKDYDLSDMKFNDMETFDALCSAMVLREFYETEVIKLMEEGIDNTNSTKFERLNNIISRYRQDINNMQSTLNITRKERKSDKQERVLDKLEELKLKAKKFYEKKMAYVYCPECKMLLFTGWFLYPEVLNKISLKCNRILDEDGTKCNTKVVITSKELVLEKKGRNLEEMMNY